jgi:hypothetical protein
MFDLAKTEIQQAIDNVNAMLSDVIDLSRNTTADVSPISLPLAVKTSIDQAMINLRQPNITFIFNFQHNFKPLVEKHRFVRALVNIITNAVEAIMEIGKKQQGIIAVSTADICIDNKRSIKLVIGNDGPLFDENDISGIFDPFYTKGKSHGTGLGLASVKKIIESHNGSILARNNTNGNGVEFIIVVPASHEEDKIFDSIDQSGSQNKISFEKTYLNNKKEIIRQPMVLIEDDKITQFIWKERADNYGFVINTYDLPQDFIKEIHLYSKDTVIYVDKYFTAQHINSLEFVESLHKQGFRNLYIETADDRSSLIDLHWLRGVVDKNPPF